jgi:signal transduction histidine kinase
MTAAAEIATESPAERWNHRVERYLPLAMLGVATVAGVAAGRAVGAVSPWPRLAGQVALVLALAIWLVRSLGNALTPWAYLVRSVGAFALTVLNPLFCVFAWVGYTDADEVFTGRAIWTAIGATAVTMAIGQSGGVPDSWGHALVFVVLLVINFGVAYTVGRFVIQGNQISADRKVAITELERVNASLQQALSENVTLQDTVLAQARDAGVQQERQRLAREIHDTITQSLAGIVSQLRAAADDPDPVSARRRVQRATTLARDALTDARRSVMDLSPAALADQTLPDALAAEVRTWAAHQDVRAETVVTGVVRPLHPEVEATVLRIAQETLANVAKHAGAARVGVTLSYLDDEVVLDVRDDGAGFDAAAPAPSTRFGLRGMRQRAGRLAGVLDIETGPGLGTAVSVRLPAVEPGAA